MTGRNVPRTLDEIVAYHDERLRRLERIPQGVTNVIQGAIVGATTRLGRDTAQSIPHATYTYLNWTDLVEEDDPDYISVGTLPVTEVVVLQRALFAISTTIQYASNSTGFREGTLTLNSDIPTDFGTQLGQQIVRPADGGATGLLVGAIVKVLEVDDRIQVYTLHNNSGAVALNINAAANASNPNLIITRLST